jgi:hypothetical protein
MKLGIILASALSLAATQVLAVPCATTDHVEEQLLARHGEEKSYYGILANENLLQIFLNESSESWSIVVEVPSRGLSCLLSTGYGYHEVLSNQLMDRVDLLPMS